MPRDVASLLKAAREELGKAGCEAPALDARLLLQEAAGLSHEEIVASPEREIGEVAVSRFREFVTRRAAHEPVSRILGWREFYGRRFRVTPDVLDPRPDTETLIEAALKLMPGKARVLDLGVGSGAIIVTLLAERIDATGVGTDISQAALDVARATAQENGLADRLSLFRGSWFEPVQGRFNLLVSNPPYIPDAEIEWLNRDVRDHDPRLALAGGADGLQAYLAIAAGTREHLLPGGVIVVEIGAGQAAAIEGIFRSARFRLAASHRDLGGHIRVLSFVDDFQENRWNPPASRVNGSG